MSRGPRTPAALGLIALFAACEGGGDGDGGLEVEVRPIVPHCTPVAGTFPSGLAVLSQASARAALVETAPPGVLALDLEAERPRLLALHNVGSDSDADGVDDASANAPWLGPFGPVMGELAAPRDDLAFVSTSNYEQVLVYDPSTATPRSVVVETPAGFAANDYPLLPPPGGARTRVGISTLACIYPPDPFDSAGGAIGPDARCDAGRPSYLTTLTAGKALAGGRLFVASSNLDASRGEVFRPGTVLVYEWIEAAGALPRARPDAATPVLFSEGFNPTGMRRFTTPGGRELVAVTVTGAIGTGTGSVNVRGEAAVEVIDPSVPRIAAVIPLGFAGPSFDGLAVDPGGRIGWLGASSQRRLYAVDLRALDDPRLYLGGPPVLLDGLSAGFPDARVFHADAPLVLPDRPDGPPSFQCEGFTHAAVNFTGREVFASDFCDGSFTRVRMDLAGAPPVPWPADRFQVAAQDTPFAPVDAIGQLRAPGVLRVRPGLPGVDYRTPDVLVVVGQPEAQLCALRVESL